MLTALRLTSMLAIAGFAGAAHGLESPDWNVLEGTAQHSLEFARVDESTPWVNPDTGAEGTFTPIASHEGPEGQVCREYAIQAIIDGREEVVYGTACRRPDGTWVEANAEYHESDPPVSASEVYSGTDWWWIIPTIAISGGYCSSHFCVGGHFGSYYPSWYDPWGFSFSYWDYGHGAYYYPYYPYYYSYYSHHHHRHFSHHRHASHHWSKPRHHYRSEYRDHYWSGHTNRRDRHSERAHSPSRRPHRDRPTDTRSRNRRSEGERYAIDRSGNRRSRSERHAIDRSQSHRSAGERQVGDRSRSRRSSGVRHAVDRLGSRRASERSMSQRSRGERRASNRSVSHRSRGERRASDRSGSRRSGSKRGARSSSRH